TAALPVQSEGQFEGTGATDNTVLTAAEVHVRIVCAPVPVVIAVPVGPVEHVEQIRADTQLQIGAGIPFLGGGQIEALVADAAVRFVRIDEAVVPTRHAAGGIAVLGRFQGQLARQGDAPAR